MKSQIPRESVTNWTHGSAYRIKLVLCRILLCPIHLWSIIELWSLTVAYYSVNCSHFPCIQLVLYRMFLCPIESVCPLRFVPLSYVQSECVQSGLCAILMYPLLLQYLSKITCVESFVSNRNIWKGCPPLKNYLPRTIRGGLASMCSQKETQEITTMRTEGI